MRSTATPAASSSGSGAAVAAGLVRLAIGTETDGSITCPAAINGIVGLKPTVGLVSRTHIVPISHSQDTAGPMTATRARGGRAADRDRRQRPGRSGDRARPTGARRDYAAALDADSLKGKRIGVMRFASGFGTDAAFETALAILRERGATLVEIKKFDDKAIGNNELTVLLTELKADLAKYLKGSPAPIRGAHARRRDRLQQGAHAARRWRCSGRRRSSRREKTKGLADPAYKKARADQLPGRRARTASTGCSRQYSVVALVGPTMPPAWKIDAVNGDQISGGGAGSLAAVAGYPHLTVPMGLVKGLPVGLSFIGPKWWKRCCSSLGYAYEQARGPFPAPQILPLDRGQPGDRAAAVPQPVRR